VGNSAHFLCFVMYVLVVAVYETAKMLLEQPTESISNSEEMFFCLVCSKLGSSIFT